MNTAQIMDILKKNLLSILCAVIAIAAVVAMFWPINKKMSELQVQSDGRAAVYQQLEGIFSQPRKLPLTDPTSTQQDPLPSFPNEKIIAEGDTATKTVSEQSKKMVEMVVEMNRNQHPLLVADALPNPLSDRPKFRFGDLYKLVLSTDKAASITTDDHLKEANLRNLRNDILNAGVPPTAKDIDDRRNAIRTNDFLPRIILVNNAPVNQPQIDAEFAIAADKVPDQLRTQVATEKKVYAAPDAFTQNPNVIGINSPGAVDIWYAQVTLWVQQDIANAIAEANANSKNIIDAPVKVLLKLTIPSPTPTGAVMSNMYMFPPGTPSPIPPIPVDGGDTAPLPKAYALSPTGRASNPMYDVIPFTLILNVDASQIPYVLNMLSKNRLIDVCSMDVASVDSNDERTKGFIYGSQPVVQITLKCEELFMREWTAPLMPDNVKQAMGIVTIAPPKPAQ